ncbi:MAG: MFS transporter, partial [Bacillota bacterium]|nr:MFS transporter [Bacillota bacterium]
GMIWAPLIKLLSSVLCKEHRGLALFYISTTFYAGGLCTKGIAIYNFSQGSFRPIFKTSALILFVVFVIWVIVSIVSTKKLVYDEEQVQAESQKGGKFKNKDFRKAVISSGLLLMVVPSLVKSMGDVGLKSWGATMIKSTYSLTESFATLLSLIVVLAGFSVPFVTRLIYKLTKSDEVKTSLYAFLLCVLPIIVLMEVGIVNKYIELVMLIIVTVLMNIITQTLVIMGAARFEKWGGAATATGILNAAASVGVFLANYGFGLIAEFFGWKYIFVVLMALVLISSVCLLIAVPKWKRFKAEI